MFERKKAVLAKALKTKATPVKVVNDVKIAHDKPAEMKPTLHLSDKDLPELKSWKVGKSYKLILEVEQTSMRQGSEYAFEGNDDSKKISASFKVISTKAV